MTIIISINISISVIIITTIGENPHWRTWKMVPQWHSIRSSKICKFAMCHSASLMEKDTVESGTVRPLKWVLPGALPMHVVSVPKILQRPDVGGWICTTAMQLPRLSQGFKSDVREDVKIHICTQALTSKMYLCIRVRCLLSKKLRWRRDHLRRWDFRFQGRHFRWPCNSWSRPTMMRRASWHMSLLLGGSPLMIASARWLLAVVCSRFCQ